MPTMTSAGKCTNCNADIEEGQEVYTFYEMVGTHRMERQVHTDYEDCRKVFRTEALVSVFSHYPSIDGRVRLPEHHNA